MSTFRFHSPRIASERRLLPRTRLLERLERRFDLRVTTISAGAGFGKTTLLAQMLEANAEHRLGRDVWFDCGPRDCSASHLGAGLSVALGIAVDSRAKHFEELCEAVWHLSPLEVAFVIDDVHFIEADSPGSELLARLVAEAPRNAHFVLAGRSSPPLQLARFRTSGLVEDLTEEELAFDLSERRRFAELRPDGAIDFEAAEFQTGWPALMELRQLASGAEFEAYLREEVLDHLDDERRQALARLSVLEWIQDDLIPELTGLELTTSELLDGIPLTTYDELGAARLHSLWRPLLQREKAAREPSTIERAAAALFDRGQILEAFMLCLQLEDTSAAEATLERIVFKEWRGLHTEDLAELLTAIPSSLRSSASASLLRAQYTMSVAPNRAREELETAASLFREAGHVVGEIETLGCLFNVYFWESNIVGALPLIARVEELSRGVESSPPLIVARGLIASVKGEFATTLECAERLQAEAGDARSIGDFMASLAYSSLGNAERALRIAESGASRAPLRYRSLLNALAIEARWQLGRLTLDELVRADSREREKDRRASSTQNDAQYFAALAQIYLSLGAQSRAEDLVALSEKALPRAIGPRSAIALAVSRAGVLANTGDIEAASTLLCKLIEESPVSARPSRPHQRGIAMLYAFAPGSRDDLDVADLGPDHAISRQVGRAAAALREREDPSLAAALDWTEIGRIGACIYPALTVELAVAAALGGNAEAMNALLGPLAHFRPHLKKLALRARDAVAKRAAVVLERVPAPPLAPIELRVLGPLELLRDGVIVDEPNWRRDRVRLLLQLLVSERRASRARLAAAIWPEQAEESARNNLRVNLAHLQSVLEPERAKSDPPWFVRHENDQLVLFSSQSLRLDVDEFEAAVSTAQSASRARATEAELGACERAVALYRGDYLADLSESVQAEGQRTRIRHLFLRAAVRAGELLLARGDAERALELGVAGVRHEELAEEAYRLQAHAYRALGDRAAARSVLRTLHNSLNEAELEVSEDSLRLGKMLGLDLER